MRELWRTIRSDVRAKGLRYWALAGAFIVAGMILSYVIERGDLYLELSYGAYQQLQRTSPFEMDHALNVVFVAVGDDEFWKGELEQRIPIKRDYLARLVAALDQADPWVLGIDFTLRSPVAEGGLVETPAYAGETAKLIAAVEAFRNHIVLPATVNEYGYDRGTDSYPLDSSIFGSYKFANPRVRQGYLNIPHDIRTIPLTVPITGTGATLPSFSQVIADILDPRNRGNRRSHAALFGGFMPTTGFVTIPAGEVLKNPAGSWRERIQHHTVLIGSFAHEDADGRGPYRDSFGSPLGDMVPGVVVHANYVEALISGHVYAVSPAMVSHLFEAALSIAVAVLFARRMRALRKVGYFLAFLTSAVLLSYFSLISRAVFFDPVLPVLAVTAHSVLERALVPRRGDNHAS